MPISYFSPKTAVGPSQIHGKGLFAVRPIRRGEIVAVKGGHVFDEKCLGRVKGRIACSFIQIEDGLYLGAMSPSEARRNKVWLNHSCQPNVGI